MTLSLAEFRDQNCGYPVIHLQPELGVNNEKLVYLMAGFSLAHRGRL